MSEPAEGQFEEYTVTAVWKINAMSPEEAKSIASKEGLWSASRVDIKQTTQCRFCAHPKGRERHDQAGAPDCRCSCNH